MVEDDMMDASDMKTRLEELGLELEVEIFRPNSTAAEWNRDNQPGIVQLDGLSGACFDQIDILKKDNPSARYFIYSSHEGIQQDAGVRGIDFVRKELGDSPLLDYVRQLLQE